MKRLHTLISTRRWDASLVSLKTNGLEHLVLIFNEKNLCASPLVRIQSECVMWDVFWTDHCSCCAELHASIQRISKEWWMLFYMRQEWWWVWLEKKVIAMNVEHNEQVDEWEAYERLGFSDMREYTAVVDFLAELWISSVRMMTNNKEKIKWLEEWGVQVIVEEH